MADSMVCQWDASKAGEKAVKLVVLSAVYLGCEKAVRKVVVKVDSLVVQKAVWKVASLVA